MRLIRRWSSWPKNEKQRNWDWEGVSVCTWNQLTKPQNRVHASHRITDHIHTHSLDLNMQIVLLLCFDCWNQESYLTVGNCIVRLHCVVLPFWIILSSLWYRYYICRSFSYAAISSINSIPLLHFKLNVRSFAIQCNGIDKTFDISFENKKKSSQLFFCYPFFQRKWSSIHICVPWVR